MCVVTQSRKDLATPSHPLAYLYLIRDPRLHRATSDYREPTGGHKSAPGPGPLNVYFYVVSIESDRVQTVNTVNRANCRYTLVCILFLLNLSVQLRVCVLTLT